MADLVPDSETPTSLPIWREMQCLAQLFHYRDNPFPLVLSPSSSVTAPVILQRGQDQDDSGDWVVAGGKKKGKAGGATGAKAAASKAASTALTSIEVNLSSVRCDFLDSYFFCMEPKR